ncbi:MAG TPA: fibronectin type III domain-containing protein [Solirubrobacteraceae bacterium]|nr:fibronectin type III domain-containing protein [Solirubrobacteraceae bacterium]
MHSLASLKAVLGAVIVPAALMLVAAPASAVKVGAHYGPEGPTNANSCSNSVSAGYAHCLAHFRTDAWARDRRPVAHGQKVSSATLGNDGAYDPSFLRSAYATPSAGGVGQTVAIVDAYDDPNAESDMAHYRSFFGLSACTTANGCFRKVNQSGAASPLPSHNSGWGQEISLDLDMVSAICESCHVVLVEASSNSMANLGASVNTAVKLGANVVTNSYGGSEYSSETSDTTSYFDHPGVAITAATGDSGYGVEFPAAAPTVTAVGGTSLYQETNSGTRDATEEAWSGAGSGCSSYEPQQAWQLAVVTEYTLTGCYKRMIADVSADANPNTGVWVYDTYGGNSGFEIFGGTSASTQIVGAVFALAGNAPGGSGEATAYPYSHIAALNYVHVGSNGKCGTYLCDAADSEHFNGPTGLGTPNGVAAFTGTPPAPPTSVPSAPQSLTAKAGNGQVALSWTAPSSTGGATSVTYELFRGTSPGGETATPIATGVSGTSFTDKGLSNGTTYYYTVKAVNSLGAGEASGEASATPASAPSAPLSLTASTASGTGVALKWSAPASSGGSAVTSYVVYRSTLSGRESAYGTVSCTASTCSATDTGTRSRTVYYYTVAAVNAIGTGPQSNQASAKAK